MINDQKEQGQVRIDCTTCLIYDSLLFNYQSNNLEKCVFTFPTELLTPVSIDRNRSTYDLKIIEDPSYRSDYSRQQLLVTYKIQRINKNNVDSFQLFLTRQNQLQELPYLIVEKLVYPDSTPKGYKLSPGLFIKLGKPQFHVSEISYQQIMLKKDNKRIRMIMEFDPNQNTKQYQCRICLKKQHQEVKDYLIATCKCCSGSIGVIHIRCLKDWVKQKVKILQTYYTTEYHYKGIKCEICHAVIPLIIDVTNGQRIDILDIKKPFQQNYIILQEAQSEFKRIIVIKEFPMLGIKYGRGSKCHIKNDMRSTSKQHAVIKQMHDGFYIFDNQSCYGTLVRYNKMEKIELGTQPHWIQIGRTIMKIALQSVKPMRQDQNSIEISQNAW